MSLEGSVKSFNGAKGYGFIVHDGQDVFVHEKECGGASPAVGDTVQFDMEESPQKPGSFVAKNVVGCTGEPENKGGKGMGFSSGKSGKGFAAGTGELTGSVKSFSEMKGWGFILYEGEDVFFHVKDMVDGSSADRGDIVKFDVEENPGKPGTMKAVNVTGGTKGKGKGKGDAWGMAPAWGMDAWGGKGGGKWGPYGGGDAWGGKGDGMMGMGGMGKGKAIAMAMAMLGKGKGGW